MKVVLFAEDHPVLRARIVELLGSVGVFTVVAVANGKEAFEYLMKPEHQVNLVMTDLSMPEMTGLELVRAIREIPRLAKIPVVVFSLCSKEEAAYALANGANAFLDKLATLEEIEETVLRYLG